MSNFISKLGDYSRSPLIADEKTSLWLDPRKEIEARLKDIQDRDPENYIIGMVEEESAFISELIRHIKPKKILEVGVNKGGSTAVILKTLDMLDLKSELHSVDILKSEYLDPVLEEISDLTDPLNLYIGKDVSAYLEEIGDEIDFCIIDTSHILPGEILNFICILPFLKEGATVVVHDQVHQFDVTAPYIKFFGPNVVVSCRILNDVVVADKYIPNFNDTEPKIAPNITSFKITKDTFLYIKDVLSALMFPWFAPPGFDYLTDAKNLLKNKYPEHFSQYFDSIVLKQLQYTFQVPNKNSQYWGLGMIELNKEFGLENIAFYGAGEFCRNLLEKELPSDLWPGLILDRNAEIKSMMNIPVMTIDALLQSDHSPKAIVITSSANENEIEETLKKHAGLSVPIFNPFKLPLYSNLTLHLSGDDRFSFQSF